MRVVAQLSRYTLTLCAHGFGPLIVEMGVQELVRVLPLVSRWGEPRARTLGRRLRLLFQELGPTFQKFGQVLSTQSDLLPDETVEELQKLHQDLPPMSAKEVQKILKRELGDTKKIFRHFDSIPRAVATVGQVHRAELLDGTVVAVKIQGRLIRKRMTADVEALEWIAEKLVATKPDLKRYNLIGTLQLFKKSLLSELDFLLEAKNYARLRKRATRLGVRVPRVFEKHSTAHILTLEWVEGRPLTALLQQGPNEQTRVIAKQLLSLLLYQVFHHGVFHGDPHPGNFLINGKGHLYMIDLGLTGELNDSHRKALLRSMRAVLSGDAEKMADALVMMASSKKTKTSSAVRLQLAEDLKEIFVELKKTGLLERGLQKVFRAAAAHDLIVDVEYVLMLKALLTVESVCRQLDPEIKVLSVAQPVIMSGLLSWANPFRFWRT